MIEAQHRNEKSISLETSSLRSRGKAHRRAPKLHVCKVLPWLCELRLEYLICRSHLDPISAYQTYHFLVSQRRRFFLPTGKQMKTGNIGLIMIIFCEGYWRSQTMLATLFCASGWTDSVRRSSRVYRREFPAERAPKSARSKILLSRLKRLSNRYPYLVSLALTFLAIFICAVVLLVVLKLRGPI